MKKKLLIFILAAFLTGSINAQSTLIDQEFWKAQPTLALVKEEVTKGFDFTNMKGYDDPLYLAINNNASTEVIQYLSDQPGIDYNRKIHDGRNYLHTTVGKNQLEVTAYLINKGCNKDMQDVNGQTPLTFNAGSGRLSIEMIQLFEKLGLNVQQKYPKNDNANLLLMVLAGDKTLKVTEYLISKGLSVQSIDDSGNNAFFYAAKSGNMDAFKYLLSKGVTPQSNALIGAAIGSRRSAAGLEVYQYLVETLKLDAQVKDAKGLSLLNYVVKKQNQDDVIAYLIKHGVDGSIVDKDGNSPFIIAAKNKSVKSLNLLWPFVKDINAQNKIGESALFNALKSADAAVVQFLISKNAAVNAMDTEGRSAAYYLLESFKTPGSRGANNTPDYNIYDDITAKLNLLINKGYDVKSNQKDGNNVIILAAAKNDVALLKLLLPLGIDINHQNNEGFTALHTSAMLAKDAKTLQYLMDNGADKNLKTELDETAYDIASENELLKENKTDLSFLQ